MMKIKCSCGCKQQLNKYDKYGRIRKYLNGHNGRKYTDKTQHKREWNHRNRQKRYEYKKMRYQNRKQKLIFLKGNKCQECGLNYDGFNACVFDFHHLKSKKFQLNVRNLSDKNWKIILKEAKKCKLLCANCHRLIIGSGY